MKKILVLLISIVNSLTLLAQKDGLVTVRAGTRIIDYFPVNERYLYSEFTPGRVWFKDGTNADKRLNYNHLTAEIEFIQGHDTLSIADRKNLKLIQVAQDTFYYDKGYIEQIKNGKIIFGRKQLIELKEIQSKDSYGTSSSGSATNSYGSLPADGNFYKLTANKDMVFKRSVSYYFSTTEDGFLPVTRNNILRVFPKEKERINTFIRSNNLKFNSREDILKLADLLNTL